MRQWFTSSLSALFILLLWSTSSIAGLTPHDIAVVVNDNPDTPDVKALSNTVAEYYCSQRGVPTANIIRLATGIRREETTEPRFFYSYIWDSLAASLAAKFGSDPDHPETDPIKCLVLCPGIPIQMWGAEPVGCVDSALALMFNETPWGRTPDGAYFPLRQSRMGNPYFHGYYVSIQTVNS